MSGLEGSLFKWINMVKGWQTRWFVLEPEIGLLSYFTVSIRNSSSFLDIKKIDSSICGRYLQFMIHKRH